MSDDPHADAGYDEESSGPYGFIAHYLIRSSPARCWECWTDDARITGWLATRAEADVRAGGDYVIESGIPYHSGRHRVEEVESGSFIAFTWFMDETPSRVEVAIRPHPEGTLLLLGQLAEPGSSGKVFCGFDPEALGFQRQAWDHSIGRLRCLLEDGREGTSIPEGDRDDEVRLSTTIAASRQDVFTALTEASALEQWEAMFNGDCVIGKGVGERYSFGWEAEMEDGDGPNRIEEWIEGERLVYSWFGRVPGKVSWDLIALEDGGTRVELRHVGFDQSLHKVWEYKLGWSASLSALRWYLERGEPYGGWIDEV